MRQQALEDYEKIKLQIKASEKEKVKPEREISWR
jgi:hypothetical protein